MSERPQGSVTGIFGLLFRETGLFLEQAFQWAEQQGKQTAQWAEQQGKQTAQWAEQQVKDARQTDVDEQKRRMSEATARQAEAEARLLEQIRLAKQAGLDVNNILAKLREEK
jgi:hypothetical protein